MERLEHSCKKFESLKAWLMATRPHTLPLSAIPVITATALAAATTSITLSLSLFAALSSLFIQIGTNLVNDALDFKKGTDNANRMGPQRASASGLLPPHLVLLGGTIAFIIALLFGIPLMLHGGWPLTLLLITSVCFGYLYTATRFSLAYNGLSEPFVFLFFGVFATIAVYFLQTGEYSIQALLAGAEIGCFSSVTLAINNLRDSQEDVKFNKRTLAVRFGRHFARFEIAALSFVPFILNLLWIPFHYPAATFLPFLVFPLAYRNVSCIWNQDPSPLYNEFLAKSALINLLFSLLLSIGFYVH